MPVGQWRPSSYSFYPPGPYRGVYGVSGNVTPPIPSSILAHVIQGGSSNFSTTVQINTTNATLFLLFGCETSANYEGDTVFSDSLSNTWTQEAWSNTVSGVITGYCSSPTTGTMQTFSFGGGVPTDPSASAIILEGPTTVDGYATANAAQPGSMSPGHAGDLLFCIAGSQTAPSGTVTINEGFTILDSISAAGGSKTLYTAYLNNATTGPYNPTWTNIPNVQSAIIAVR